MIDTHSKEFQAIILKINESKDSLAAKVLFWKTAAIIGWVLVVAITVTEVMR